MAGNSTGNTFEFLRENSPLVSVGVLSADMMNLARELELVESAGVKMLHFDVMDGRFCPSLTFGPAFVKAVKTDLLKDVHLMIEHPLDKLESFVAAGADIVTVNIESTRHIHRAMQMLGQMENVNDPARGICRGVVLNPGTPLEAVEPILDDLEIVLLLAVNPGWGGQSFIPSAEGKLAGLVEMVRRSGRSGKDIIVGIDGGIKKDNIARVAGMGAEIIVTGSAVFDGKDPQANAKFMIQALNQNEKN